ncbi:hypothetical protein AKJ09_07574 [Labilithrix luteola]|uniref:Glutathione S-transferase n=1 Tax=Labilithrix luteola TaxID=1391654 RepID=A0A0K1Q4Z7_9BACT|nr:glutathione S-transferase C-terminal domain-containing protein [Labilithrix luteola]AKV00911.1 hypothetical protein AKJ09_07574 [Labilithrix luteola]
MQFVDLETAKAASGLRLVVAGGFPSPWSVAAKAIFQVKKVPFVAVRYRAPGTEICAWTGTYNAPAALYDAEPVRSGWAEILELGERLAPEMPLVPSHPEARARMFGYGHELMGEGGLLWSMRQYAIDAGLASSGEKGFPLVASKYLAPRYGWAEGCGPRARARFHEGLAVLDGLLRSGKPWLLGDTFTALDIYAASAMAVIAPLPEKDCAMLPPLRQTFEWLRGDTGNAITPALLAHRARVHEMHMPLPLDV